MVEHLLDVGRVDVLAAADDHVLDAVDDVGIAVVVEIAEVAAVQPAAGQRGRSIAGRLVIAEHDIGSADADFANLARTEAGAVGREDHDLDAVEHSADGTPATDFARFVEFDASQRDQRGGFGEAISGQQANRAAAAAFDPAQQRGGNRGAAGHDQGQRLQSRRRRQRVVEQFLEHGRDGGEECAAVALYRFEAMRDVEARMEHQRRTAHQHGVDALVEAERII